MIPRDHKRLSTRHFSSVIWLMAWLMQTACQGLGSSFTHARAGLSIAYALQPLESTTLQVPQDPLLTELCQHADSAWAKRQDRLQLRAALTDWQHALQLNPNNLLLLLKISHAFWQLADITPKTQTYLLTQLYEAGMNAGALALAQQASRLDAMTMDDATFFAALKKLPNNAQAALFWYAANLGEWVLLQGPSYNLWLHARVIALMQKVLAIDETFAQAAAHRYLGNFLGQSPFYVQADDNQTHAKELAKHHFEMALTLSPHFLPTKVDYAVWRLLWHDDVALAQHFLQETMLADTQVLPDVVPEQELAVTKAKWFMSQALNLF